MLDAPVQMTAVQFNSLSDCLSVVYAEERIGDAMRTLLQLAQVS